MAQDMSSPVFPAVGLPSLTLRPCCPRNNWCQEDGLAERGSRPKKRPEPSKTPTRLKPPVLTSGGQGAGDKRGLFQCGQSSIRETNVDNLNPNNKAFY
jgi:hypothetical protein